MTGSSTLTLRRGMSESLKGRYEFIHSTQCLLSHAGLMSGIRKYDQKILKERGSSPRLLVHDTSLMVVASGEGRSRLLEDRDRRGHLVESAIGAYLLARSVRESFSVNWWRDGVNEVDFVVTQGRKRTAIEVKSGHIVRSSPCSTTHL